jgi:hypothetical protein
MARGVLTAFAGRGTMDILTIMRNYDGAELSAFSDLNAQRPGWICLARAHIRRRGRTAPGQGDDQPVLSAIAVEARTFDLDDEAGAWAWIDGTLRRGRLTRLMPGPPPGGIGNGRLPAGRRHSLCRPETLQRAVRCAGMTNRLQTTETGQAGDRQRAEFHLRLGETREMKMTVDVSSSGLLAITALVSGILLSTTVLVRSAVREGRRFPGWLR